MRENLEVKELAIPEVKVIRFARFPDHRGYFSEQYRFSDFERGEVRRSCAASAFLRPTRAISRAGTVRGLHFQWNPYMGKLVRTIRGHMIDVVLDIRKGSPTYGKIIAYDMPVRGDENYADWIWVPPGFAHGNTFPDRHRHRIPLLGRVQPGQRSRYLASAPTTSTGPSASRSCSISSSRLPTTPR